MTTAARGQHDNAWRFVVLFALLLFCWSHQHALQLSGFSDDLGLLAELPQRAVKGTLVADVFAKWIGPLWPGSTMWRPLPYASFALDAIVWSYAPGLWRITNLLLHLGVATLTGLITARLTEQRLAAAAAFATVLLVPWAPEVTLWLVGRFDGWATFAIAVSLWAALKSGAADRWLVLSLVAAVVAYSSKESALVLPMWIVLVAMLQTALVKAQQQSAVFVNAFTTVRMRGLLIGGHVVVAVAYLLWRSALFSAQAISVYAGTPEHRVSLLSDRILLHLAFPASLAELAPTAAAIVASVAVGSLFVPLTLGRCNRLLAFVGGVMALSVVVAVAVFFANPAGSGDGFRLYYLATIGLALIAAATVKTSNKRSLMMLSVFMIALAVWQSRVAAEWARASRTIDGASQAISLAAAHVARNDFGLVLLPDLMGHVPVARNAQGALLALKDGTSPARDFFIIFTPPQLAEWHQLALEDVVGKLTQRADAPAKVTRYYCFDSSKQSLEQLGYWSPGTLLEWKARWREAVSARCPDLAF